MVLRRRGTRSDDRAALCTRARVTTRRRKIRKVAGSGADKVAESGRQMADLGKELYDKGRKMVDDASSMFERGRKLIDESGNCA